MDKVVLQKYIAESGYSSRRRAEELIRAGQVEVNGQTAELGQRVNQTDRVVVGNKELAAKPDKVYLIINKPEGYVCTNRKFRGEDNVFDLLVDYEKQKAKSRLFVVGRLDKNSQGLVLLTNDGELAERLTHPRNRHEKEYLVQISNVEHRMSNNKTKGINEKFMKGLRIDGKIARAKEAEYLGNNKFRIVLTQGMKRQIREMFKAAGLEVKRLKRVRIHNLELGSLKTGKWRCLKIDEIEKLKH